MAITKKPQMKPQDALGGQMAAALQKFIDAAPDAPKARAKPSEDSVQITLRLSREQLERLTNMAKRQGIPRANYIKRSVFLQLEADEAK